MSTSESIYFMISNLGTHFFLNPSHLTLSSGDWLPKGVKKEVEYWRGPRTVQLRVSSPSLTQHLYYLKFVLHCQVFFWPPPMGRPFWGGFSSNRIQTLTGVPTLTHEKWQSHYPEPSVLPTFIGLFGKSCHPSLILHIHYLISVNFCQVFSRQYSRFLQDSLRFSKVLRVISIKPSIAIIPKGWQNVKSKISLFR